MSSAVKNNETFHRNAEYWRYVCTSTQEVINLLPDSNEKVKKWLTKKSYTHVKEVIKVCQQMIANGEFMEKAKALLPKGTEERDNPEQTVFSALTTISIFHDLGRAAEVDTTDGSLKKGYDHALASYELMKEAGKTLKGINGRPEILLPVKYHGCLNLKEALENDPEYQKAENKELILLYAQIIRDADKIANLEEKAKFGFKGSLEERDPSLSDEYKISPEVAQSIESKKQVNNKDRKTRVDAMLRIGAWAFDLSTDFAKEYVKKENVVGQIFDQVGKLMETAKEKSIQEGTFNQEEFDKTQKQLVGLQKHFAEYLPAKPRSIVLPSRGNTLS